ncbi:MAG: XRE family transcriptional regulator [Hyphomicrobiales bacterium]|nr:XRE family transcriptional regulator [Hyphomicrobiales bacterium]
MSIKKQASGEEPLEVTEKLGKTIKRLRNAYNYSLGDLSEQSGVAKSIISQIEKNETNPTISTLFKLSRALNAPIEDMLKGGDDPALIDRLTTSATPLLVSDDGKCRLRIVGWVKVIELVQTYYFEADAGGLLESDPHPAGSIENLTMMAGQVEVAIGDERFALSAGETARYRADRPHRIANIGAGKASAIMVNLLGPVAAAGLSLRPAGD